MMLDPMETDGSGVDKAGDTHCLWSLSNPTRTFAIIQARLPVAIPSYEWQQSHLSSGPAVSKPLCVPFVLHVPLWCSGVRRDLG